MILRIPALVRTIPIDVNAAASSTRIRGSSLYHAQHFHHLPLTSQPLPSIVLPPMTTMFVSALWHNVGWSMLLWGGMHGVY